MLSKIRRSSTMTLLLSPVGVLIISAVRLLIVANYNMGTALAMLNSGGYINTLLGTVFPLIPVLLPYLALVLMYLNRVIASCLAFIATALIAPATMSRASAKSLVLHDWHLMIGGGSLRQAILIILAVPTGTFILFSIASSGPKVFIRAFGTIAIIVLLPLIVRLYSVPLSGGFYTGLLSKPWLPAEAISLTTHKTVIVYQLNSDGYWLEVLNADDRSVQYYQMNQISSRTICQPTGDGSMRPLVTLVTGSSVPKQCSYYLNQDLGGTFPPPWTRSVNDRAPAQVRNNLLWERK